MVHRRTAFAVNTLLAGLIAFSGSAWGTIFTVGTGAGCSYGTIQSALNAAAASAGADTVRLTRSLTYEPEANTINDTGNLNPATDNIKTVVSGAGGDVKIIACIEDPAVIKKILAHLDEKALSAAPGMLPECRAPPRAGLFKGV